MYFRNITLFRIPPSVCADLADQAYIESGFADHALRDCGPIELETSGFVSPFGRGGETFTHRIGDFTLLAIGIQTKILPAAVVNDFLSEKIAEVTEREDRKVGARERKRMKEEILVELLARAFIRPSRVFAYIDHISGWLVIDTASRKAAENVVTMIREALGRFPLTPVIANESPRALMTDWVINAALPEALHFGDECELRDPAEEGAVVRCRRQEIESDELREHLKSGKQVFALGLDISNRVSFVLTEDLSLRKFRLLDIALDELDDEASESARAELDARFALMTLELRVVLQKLDEIFGLPHGEVPSLRLDPTPTPKCMRESPEISG